MNGTRGNRREEGISSLCTAPIQGRRRGCSPGVRGSQVGSAGHLLKTLCMSSNRNLQSHGVQVLKSSGMFEGKSSLLPRK